MSKFKMKSHAITAGEFGKQLEDALSEVEANMTKFAHEAALHEPQVLNKMFGEAQCIVEAEAMVAAVGVPLAVLGSVIDSITHMDRERSKLKNKSAESQPASQKKKAKRS